MRPARAEPQSPSARPPGARAVPRRALLRVALGTGTVLLAGPLAGCGFQLRGAESARLPFARLHAGFSRNSSIGAEFRRTLRTIDGTVLVDEPSAADAVLEVQNELRDRQVLGFSRTGSAREYRLRLQLRWRLHDGKGRELVPVNTIALTRELTALDARELIAKQEEESLLVQDMTIDLVQQLLRQLAAVRPAP